MKVIHNLRMDLARCSCTPVVSAVQGEANTRELIIDLYDNGVAWEIPAGTTAAVSFKKPDGLRGIYDKLPNGDQATTVAGSTVTAILAPQALTVPGEVIASIVFFDKDLDRLATFPFRIRVAVDPAGGQHVSNDYYRFSTMEQVSDALEDFLAKAEEALAVVHDAATLDAPAIVCEAVGDTIMVSDASNRHLPYLSIYGKTTQNGTPAPSDPVPLESVGDTIGVVVAGKNLFDPTFFLENGWAETNGVYHGSSKDLYNKVLRGCFAKNTQYTVSFKAWSPETSNTTLYVMFYYTDETSESVQVKNKTEQQFVLTSAVGKTIDKLRFSYHTTPEVYVRDFQLEVGTAATAYEPYIGLQAAAFSAPNGLWRIDETTDGKILQTHRDEIDFVRGTRVKRIHTLVLSGTENFKNDGTELALPLPYPCIDNINNVFCLCSHYKSTNRYKLISKKDVADFQAVATNAGNLRFVDHVNFPTGDPEAFKAWLAQQHANGTPVTVAYALATPTEEAVSTQELASFAALHSYKPKTTVLSDAGAELGISYIADTKTYIDGKLAAISAALLNA